MRSWTGKRAQQTTRPWRPTVSIVDRAPIGRRRLKNDSGGGHHDHDRGLLVAHVLLLLQTSLRKLPAIVVDDADADADEDRFWIGGLTKTTRIGTWSRAGRMAGVVLKSRLRRGCFVRCTASSCPYADLLPNRNVVVPGQVAMVSIPTARSLLYRRVRIRRPGRIEMLERRGREQTHGRLHKFLERGGRTHDAAQRGHPPVPT
jgi:hypothetical protein